MVVAIGLPSPAGDGVTVRFLVHAANRARALTRLRNLGLRAVYLRGNAEPPTPDEITAVLHHPDGLLWRSTARELWHSARLLPREPAADAHTVAEPVRKDISADPHPVDRGAHPADPYPHPADLSVRLGSPQTTGFPVS